jgi:hypothetical protein
LNGSKGSVRGWEPSPDAFYVRFPDQACPSIPLPSAIWHRGGGLLLSSQYLVPVNPDGSYTAAGLERVDDERMRALCGSCELTTEAYTVEGFLQAWSSLM